MSSKITALTALTSTQTDDVLPIVDVHDTTMAASGTTKQITVGNLHALLAPLASPTLTGTPSAPTATALTSTTQLATTAYADAATGVEKARGLAAEALLAPLASPGLTGTPTAPTKTALTNGTALATTAYTDAAVSVENVRALAAEALLAPKASPGLTGTPTAPTATALTSTTQVATTAYADAAVAVEKSRALAAEALALLLSGGTMSGAIAMGSHKITGATPGASAGEVATFDQIPLLPAVTSIRVPVVESGAYVVTGQGSTSTSAGAWTLGQVFFAPFDVPASQTFTGLATDVSAAATGGTTPLIHLGLYADNGTGTRPSGSPLSNTEVTLDPTTSTGDRFVAWGTPQAFGPVRVWAAWMITSGTALSGQPTMVTLNPAQNIGLDVLTNSSHRGWIMTTSGSASTLPAVASLVRGGGSWPIIGMKAQ